MQNETFSFKKQISENKPIYYGLGVVVIIIIVISLLSIFGGDDSVIVGDTDQNTDQALTIPTLEDRSLSTAVIKRAKKKATNILDGAMESLRYTQALAEYKDARVQLSSKCEAFPNNVTYKNGTSIMLDNRSAYNRAVILGTAYKIGAYDFKIIKLSSPVLPAMWLLDCDQSQNVASV